MIISPAYRITLDAPCSPEKPQFPGSYAAISGLRYYNPGSGRWINRDPIEENGGVNLYEAIVNNTVSLIDALGASSDGLSWDSAIDASASFKITNRLSITAAGSKLDSNCCIKVTVSGSFSVGLPTRPQFNIAGINFEVDASLFVSAGGSFKVCKSSGGWKYDGLSQIVYRSGGKVTLYATRQQSAPTYTTTKGLPYGMERTEVNRKGSSGIGGEGSLTGDIVWDLQKSDFDYDNTAVFFSGSVYAGIGSYKFQKRINRFNVTNALLNLFY